MGRLFKILTSLVWLLVWGLAVQSVDAQSGRYPPADEAVLAMSDRAAVERIETSFAAADAIECSDEAGLRADGQCRQHSAAYGTELGSLHDHTLSAVEQRSATAA